MTQTSFTFSKQHKLLKHKDFVVCYAQAKKYYSSRFILFVYQRPKASPNIPDIQNITDNTSSTTSTTLATTSNTTPWRLGIGVSKKNGNAVTRNRIKRILREFARLQLQKAPDGYDFVIVPKKTLEVSALNSTNVLAELRPLFQKVFQHTFPLKKLHLPS